MCENSRFQNSESHTWRIIPVSKWLIAMVIVSPVSRVVPLLNGLNGLYIGVTNYLLTGMILQAWFFTKIDPFPILR